MGRTLKKDIVRKGQGGSTNCAVGNAHHYKALHLLSLLALSLLLWTVRSDAAPPASSPASIVAVADIHGDFDDFVAILRHANLIDTQNHWTGGRTTFVQLGDVLDRGPKPRDAMDLIMALEKEASAAGGHVEPLLGNHEMMNIMGDLRYVTPENYAAYVDAKSEDRRQSAYKEYLKWREHHAALLAEIPHPLELTPEEWMARHPLGFMEQREAFGPNGIYGKWLRGHAAVTEVGGVIFLHGGISPVLTSMKLDAINARVRDEIGAFDSYKQFMVDQSLILPFFNLQEITAVVQAEISAEQKSKVRAIPALQTKMSEFLQFPNWVSVRTEGPLWFRGYDQWSDEEGGPQVDKILQSFKANHLVVGHTVQKGGRIRSRFGGKVFLADTGMLSSYYPGGRASAIEIEDSVKFTADYMDQKDELLEPATVSK